jgi:hypothetical protein
MDRRRTRMTRASTAVKAIGWRGFWGGIHLSPPGRRSAPLPALTSGQGVLAGELRAMVEELAIEIGARNTACPDGYGRAAAAMSRRLAQTGLAVRRQAFVADGVECANLDIEILGTRLPEEIVVVGAHYDSVDLPGLCPAANDNASGCAAVIALAQRLATRAHDRTLRFALFANEEPPYFWTSTMGSLVYANACRERGEKITAMLTPETIGCYSDAPGSQRYPLPLGPIVGDRGDFVAFVGASSASGLVKQCTAAFQAATPVRCAGAALPAWVPMAAASDHWSFWKNGYPALMVTDTAPYRYRWYHTPQDTPEKLNYEMMARVVEGLEAVVGQLASSGV